MLWIGPSRGLRGAVYGPFEKFTFLELLFSELVQKCIVLAKAIKINRNGASLHYFAPNRVMILEEGFHSCICNQLVGILRDCKLYSEGADKFKHVLFRKRSRNEVSNSYK